MRVSPSIRYIVATSAGFLHTSKAGNNTGHIESIVPSIFEATEYTSLAALTRAVKRWKEKNWQLTGFERECRILIPSDVHVK